MQEGKFETYLWVEKYRPKTIEDVILDEETRKQFHKFINDNEITNLLFYGGPGCGKSTTARILCDFIIPKEGRELNVLYLNGSEQRGISIVRDMIIEFLKYKSMNSKHKIIFIDEADYLTDESFSALRNVYEKYYENGRFILTCNYIHKIPDAIRSRSMEFKFKELPDEFIKNYCVKILENENVTYNMSDVNKIITYCYPDMRKIIQNLQRFTINNNLVINNDKDLIDIEDTIVMYFIDMVNSFMKRQYDSANLRANSIINICNEKELDYIQIYRKLFSSEDILSSIKILVNKYLNEMNKCVFLSMHFIAFVFETGELLKSYHK